MIETKRMKKLFDMRQWDVYNWKPKAPMRKAYKKARYRKALWRFSRRCLWDWKYKYKERK